MSQQDLDLNWSILRDATTCLTCYFATELNNWSIRHPYVAAVTLIYISGTPELLLTPLRIARYMCFLPFRLILWPFKLLTRFILYIVGFRRQGVAKGSYASRYQSRRYGGYVPPQSTFSKFQAHGATDDYEDEDEPKSTFAAPVSFMAGIGVWFVLGRAWGWWYYAMSSSVDVRWCELSQYRRPNMEYTRDIFIDTTYKHEACSSTQ